MGSIPLVYKIWFEKFIKICSYSKRNADCLLAMSTFSQFVIFTVEEYIFFSSIHELHSIHETKGLIKVDEKHVLVFLLPNKHRMVSGVRNFTQGSPKYLKLFHPIIFQRPYTAIQTVFVAWKQKLQPNIVVSI